MKECDYCGEPTDRTVEAVGTDVPVCVRCGVLLSSPLTGARLIRGHLCMRLRGKMDDRRLKRMVEGAMPYFEAMKRKDAS